MDCSLPGFSVHGIFHARILEWVAISSSWTEFKKGFVYFIVRVFTGARLFSSYADRGCSLVMCGFLIAAASLAVEHGLQGAQASVVAHGLSCPAARGIFPHQGSNPRPRMWTSANIFHMSSPTRDKRRTNTVWGKLQHIKLCTWLGNVQSFKIPFKWDWVSDSQKTKILSRHKMEKPDQEWGVGKLE